ncbi:hypothetical protein [Aequorivita marina]|uniref:hypothetical protein n=1 Tax=Aequorivita marina TaxID=3073654 RepID=UPI002876347D|nr:hypothetical protein [Aequorivita sp. S2608]MDS1296807.1 hypothetical protein [Aequorivita sp. S2608]
MKPILSALILLLTVVGCSTDDDCGCTIISLDVNIALTNAAGDDLLDPDNPNSYKESAIKVYHLINDEEQRSGVDDVLFQGEDGTYVYTTFVNYEGDAEYPITYIDWSETDRDTIKSEIYRTDNQTRAIKIWYNDELMWDVADGSAPYFTIVK